MQEDMEAQERLKEFQNMLRSRYNVSLDNLAGYDALFYAILLNKPEIVDDVEQLDRSRRIASMRQSEVFGSVYETTDKRGLLPLDKAILTGDIYDAGAYETIKKVTKENSVVLYSNNKINQILFCDQKRAIALAKNSLISKERRTYENDNDFSELRDAAMQLKQFNDAEKRVVPTIQQDELYARLFVERKSSLFATAIANMDLENMEEGHRSVYEFFKDFIKINPGYKNMLMYGSAIPNDAFTTAIDRDSEKIVGELLELDADKRILKNQYYHSDNLKFYSPKTIALDSELSNANILAYTLATSENPKVMDKIIQATKDTELISQKCTFKEGTSEKKITAFDILGKRFMASKRAFWIETATTYATRDYTMKNFKELVQDSFENNPDLQKFYLEVAKCSIERNNSKIRGLNNQYRDYLKHKDSINENSAKVMILKYLLQTNNLDSDEARERIEKINSDWEKSVNDIKKWMVQAKKNARK